MHWELCNLSELLQVVDGKNIRTRAGKIANVQVVYRTIRFPYLYIEYELLI